jgi:hypothetical protein
MSSRDVWSEEQRSRLIAQLTATSRAFAAALPAENAIDGLIINLHLCLTLELSPAEVQRIFSPRVVTFLAGMLAAAHSEGIEPQVPFDPGMPSAQEARLVQTQLGVIDGSGALRAAPAPPTSSSDGVVHLVFRSRASQPPGTSH